MSVITLWQGVCKIIHTHTSFAARSYFRLSNKAYEYAFFHLDLAGVAVLLAVGRDTFLKAALKTSAPPSMVKTNGSSTIKTSATCKIKLHK